MVADDVITNNDNQLLHINQVIKSIQPIRFFVKDEYNNSNGNKRKTLTFAAMRTKLKQSRREQCCVYFVNEVAETTAETDRRFAGGDDKRRFDAICGFKHSNLSTAYQKLGSG